MTVGIVGLGLIGGSIGMALRQASHRVIGFDDSPKAAEVALSRACVEQIVPLDAFAECELVFVATPPDATVPVLASLAETLPEITVLTDVASVKTPIVEWAASQKLRRFVGGHPMAGNERTGAAFASAWMFRHATWLLTPLKSTESAATKLVETAVKAMGASPLRITAEDHDRHVAILSHLPHALAAVLVEQAQTLERTEIGAGSWKDLTRVAGVDPDLWSQILLGNRKAVAEALGAAEGRLAALREALESEDAPAVKALFQSARMAKVKSKP